MSSNSYGECKKFQPNIFNKIKCTYCFKPKEEHSNEALESNRVTRKAVKCGYLFVAPFSDFSNPINKTKRWQRRWFVLYDDGELKYALDDYPETVPQACIDMNKVLTVQAAEDATSHPFSLCIDTGESLHYVKATCREEAQWWSDVLNSYKGRKTKANGVNSTPYSTRITSSSSSSVWESGDIFPTRERDVHVTSPTSNNENNMSAANVQTKIYVGSPPTRDKVSSDDKIRLRNSSSTSSRSSPNQQSDYTRSNPNQITNNADYSRHSTNNNNSHSEYSRTNNNSEFTTTEYRTSSSNTSDYTRSSSSNDFLRSPTSVNNGSASDFARNSSKSSSDFIRNTISGGKNAVGLEITVHSPSERRSSEHSRSTPNTMNNSGASNTGNSEYSRSSTTSLTDASSSPLGSLSSINVSTRLSANESASTRSSATSRLNAGNEGHNTSSRTNHTSATSRLTNEDGKSTRLNHTSASSRLNSSDTGSTRLSHGSAAASRLDNDVSNSTRLTNNTRLSHSSSGISSGSSTRLSNSSMEDVSSTKMNGLASWDTTDKGPSSPRRSSSSASHASTLIMDEKPVRGDPDGCGLDPLSPLRRHSPTPPELRLDLTGNSEHYLNIKKGWLMKQANNGQSWNKHWFVLRGCSLLYYRDPKAEETGVLDGVVALNNVTSLSEVPVARNFGFQITTWDSKRTVLSAVTAGIRTNWMSAIKRTGTLSLLEDKNDGSSPTVQTDSPSTPRSLLFSSDDEYRTASEGGRRGSTASDWGEILPPSPPLIRTPISRVKERARSISRSGGSTSGGAGSVGGSSSRLSMSHRSRSSPPSSRRSTLDSVRTEDLSLPCCGELPEPEMEPNSLILNDKLSTSSSSILTDPRQHRLEVEELKVQLNNSLLELTNAETEILSLKHFKLQADELSKKLHRCEELLKQKSEELNELGTYKTRYFQEKSTWEQELNAAEIELVTSGQRVEELCRQLGSSREQVVRLREELENVTRSKQELEERMNRGMEENENLYRRIRDLEGNHHSLRESKGRSLDSLSDLTNVFLDLDLDQLDKDRVVEEFDNLRTRFEKAVSEIRIMKRELRLAQSEQDCVELSLIAMGQELKAQQELSDSQTSLMACKIQDLTLKLSQAEKQVRAFRHKMSKLETRDKRHRSLSLKADGKESLSLCKELEEKLFQLEGKLNQLEREGVNTDKLSTPESPSRLSSSTKMTRLRRKSLDSVNEQTNIDPMKILFRVTDLEKRINKASTGFSPMSQIDEKPRQLPSISRDEVDSRPSPTSAIVILNENSVEQREQSRAVPKLTRQNSGDSPTSSPVKPKFNISSSSAVDEVTALRSLPNEYDGSRSGNELKRSINEDESAHASLLTSIEYEVSQIESLVREHSVSLNELDLSRADSSLSLNDSAWIADLSAKCGEIKQQIVSLQECLKNESGTSVGSAVAVVCTKCCSSENTEFVDDKSHIERSRQTPCKQCYEYELQLRKQQDQCASMKKLMQDREEALRRNQATPPCLRCKELEERMREYKERVERLQDKPSSSSSSCTQCLSLQSELNANQSTYLSSMKQLETLCEANFDKCYQLESMIQDKDKTLVEEIEKKRREYEKKMNELSNEYEEEKEHLISMHEDQIVQFKEKIRTLESRLGTLDSDYGEEISKLRSVYEETLAGAGAQEYGGGTGSKYKHEMEHVKSLCEKGLQTMELSYRRMIDELKAKHSEEIESLKQEKEQALREETEATLAALDVMRKAHDLEVEKKMNSVMKRLQANHDISTLHTQHQSEMEAIKQEIISLSEKYSAKCVESSDLNERLRQVTRSLTSARAHIGELEARNSKLRAHINEAHVGPE